MRAVLTDDHGRVLRDHGVERLGIGKREVIAVRALGRSHVSHERSRGLHRGSAVCSTQVRYAPWTQEIRLADRLVDLTVTIFQRASSGHALIPDVEMPSIKKRWAR